ncbi:hypothetical protein NQZ68_011377 [Dissostichus eleginoides]|nr:hypothetical protein NQZ68_011377 [Dissostichus eleginoides]
MGRAGQTDSPRGEVHRERPLSPSLPMPQQSHFWRLLYQSRWQSAHRPGDAASHLQHMDSGARSCRSAPRLH